jgi:hypothetical protein
MPSRLLRRLAVAIFPIGLALMLPLRASAIPLFAHQLGVTCQKCHTVIPHLNDFGAHFMADGERVPGVKAGPAFPISVKTNLVDSSEFQGEGPDGKGLPKAIVDEIEVFTAGTIGSRANYFVEQYLVDGGEPGLLRDLWVNDRLNPWSDKTPVYAQVGQFTLPLPVDPETFRETYQDYTPYGQQVGNNPFIFFNPKTGGKISIGDTLSGTNVQLFAGPGYDRQSGLAALGTDIMGYGQQVIGPFTLSTYHYQGERPDGPTFVDRFYRNGYALVYNKGKWTSESLYEIGFDSNCQATSAGCPSSGGFTQLRYAIGPRLFALARYEGTDDPTGGFTRDGVLLLGYGPSHNSRVTIEDVIEHVPNTTNTMNFQFTIAY